MSPISTLSKVSLLSTMSTSDTDSYPGSLSSFSMADPPLASLEPLPLVPHVPNTNVGVGLSSGSLNLSRRKMLDLVNKLVSTGQVLPSHVFPII
jgi:hypothetical protein